MQTLTSNTDNRGVLTLTMNRPDVHNAFNPAMIRELTAALIDAELAENVRIVVLTGSGSSFSAGADLNWMRSLVHASLDDNQRDAMELADLMRRLNYLSKPTIARINGSAFGGGVGLIATCDITLAVEAARFGLTEARLGLAPAVISPYVFRRIGEHQSRRYFQSGEQFDSLTAQEIGLIQQRVSTEQLDRLTEDRIVQLLKSGPEAMAHCKQLAFIAAGHNIETQRAMDAYTTKLIAGLRVSDEGQEGLTAFLEKRTPGWIGKG